MLSNGAQQSPQPPHIRNGSTSNNQFPRHMSTSSLNIGNGQSGGASSAARNDGIARSPPSRQNTGHVPCKFFRQGACQAGPACPFSHDLASTTDNVCKYFSKGNCKFGPKCANVHVLPDGRRINYNKGNMPPMAQANLNLGGRVNPDAYHGQSSALTNSFIRAQGAPSSPYGQAYGPFTSQEDGFVGRQPNVDINIPIIDTSYASHPGSNYGSPRDEMMDRYSLGLSPVAQKGLSVLDAPLPASFDSNGISWIARHGPVASSVPTKFGIDSPPGSVGVGKDGHTSEALKNLHSSAFGDDTRDRFNGIPSSPPAEEYFGKRTMHSHRLAKTKGAMSASLPKAIEQDWGEQFTFEEDLLPDVLRDLMTPQEKARRNSRHTEDEGVRPIYTGSSTGTPSNDTPTKFGSPSNASPSSRWGPYFQHKTREEDEKISRASAFGHVGSPLRNSTLHPGASPSSRPIARPTTSGDASPYLASPPRQSSMSIISQQLQRTRLARTESTGSDSGLLPSSARSTGNPIGSGRSNLAAERQASSSGRFTTPIDEEQGDFVFSMEGMEDDEEKKREKRSSGGWPISGATKSPNLGPVGGGRNGSISASNGTGLTGMFGGR